MTLKRLSPLIHQSDVGYVQLWRDELTEIVRLMRQLDGADVRIEADDYLIDDVETDLPNVGSSRLSSFRVTATRTTDGATQDLLEVDINERGCQIKATDPDLTTLGAADAIKTVVERCRRISPRNAQFIRNFDITKRSTLILIPPLLAGTIWFAAILVIGGIVTEAGHAKNPRIPVPVVITSIVLAILLFFLILSGFVRAKTILHTGTRAEAPTFWQEHRADIAINVIVGVLFYLLGLLTTHL